MLEAHMLSQSPSRGARSPNLVGTIPGLLLGLQHCQLYAPVALSPHYSIHCFYPLLRRLIFIFSTARAAFSGLLLG